jgi:hypothetical protein
VYVCVLLRVELGTPNQEPVGLHLRCICTCTYFHILRDSYCSSDDVTRQTTSTYTHTHTTHTRTHTRTYTHACTHTPPHTHARTHAPHRTRTHIHTHTHTYTHTYTHTHTRLFHWLFLSHFLLSLSRQSYTELWRWKHIPIHVYTVI